MEYHNILMGTEENKKTYHLPLNKPKFEEGTPPIKIYNVTTLPLHWPDR
jgi:hypothetical protein